MSSESAILIDPKSGQILYDKNAKKKMYPASLTKIVTGIIALEEGKLNDLVSISKKAAETHGTSVYLLENEKVKLKRLVQGLLINSGNDAGTAIAEYISGSNSNFAEKMNDFVQTKIGVTDSNFTNPHGLFGKNHYTTAYDMAKISQYAMKNNTFKAIVGTKELEWNGKGWQTTIYNHHRMLGNYEGTTGIKNGYVPQSGFTLTTSAERDGLELIAVTLNAPSSQKAYDDTAALLDYGFNNFSSQKLTTDQMFTDKKGNQYKLSSPIFLTLPSNEKITKEVIRESLVIKGEDGTVLSEAKLTQIKDTSNQQTDTKREEIQNDNWLFHILQPFII